MRSPRWPREPAWALILLDAVGDGTIPPRDLTATIARQLLALGKPASQRRASRRSGASVRPTSKEKAR